MLDSKLNYDSLNVIFSYCDIISICNLLILNKKINKIISYFLKIKYKELISIMQKKSNKYFIRNNDIFELMKLSTSIEFQIFLILIKKFNQNRDYMKYSVWFNNEKFDECNHPPNLTMRKNIEHSLWYNSDRLNLKNEKLNLIFMNLLNRYQGMGHDFSLFNIKGTDQYFFDYQGGSNGFEYDDNIERLSDIDPQKINLLSLNQAIDVLIP